MKKNIAKKGIALFTTLIMVAAAFVVTPMLGSPAYAATADGMVLGTDVLGTGSNTADAQTIYMADKAWRVIGYDGEGVASSQDTMTLIAAGNLKTGVLFRADYTAADANHYSKSNLKTEVEAIADSFSSGEKSGIAARDLASGSYNGADTDCIAGDEVKGALLWPLSTKEAYALDGDLRIVDPENQNVGSSYWWLRSPGNSDRSAAFVRGDGYVFFNHGYYVANLLGVRPAFNYNLKSIIFTSAATGGKSSGTVGADSLKSVGTNSTGEWKVTVKSGHDGFAVDKVTTCDGKVLNIKYSGAVTGSNEYISAIIISSDGSVKYYGRLALASDENGAVAKVNIDGKMESGDKLYVFNEQFNGDYQSEGGTETPAKTDFASEPVAITIPAATGHDLTPTAKIDPTCTKAGTEAYWTCSACEKIFSDENGENEITEPVEIPALEHKYGTWVKLNDTQHQRVCEHDASHVEKENHKWDAGKETKPATTTSTGIKTYTCTVCSATKEEAIPKKDPGSDPNLMGSDGTALGAGASAAAADKAITSMKKDVDPAGSKFGKLRLKSTKQTKTSVKIAWTKVSGAKKYVIYGNACGTKNKMKKLATVTGSSKNFTKILGKKVKKGTYYKFLVVALDKNNKVVSTSKMIHVATTGGKVGNHKSVTVKAKVGKKTKAVSKVTVKKGKTLKLKATLNPKSKKLKVKNHVGARYESTNTKIATVSSKGVIKAKAKGTCYVYVYAQNGVCKKVKVTVK